MKSDALISTAPLSTQIYTNWIEVITVQMSV